MAGNELGKVTAPSREGHPLPCAALGCSGQRRAVAAPRAPSPPSRAGLGQRGTRQERGDRDGDGLWAPRSRGRGGFVPHSVTDFEVLELELNEQ